MELKYKLEFTKEDGTIVNENYKTLKEISEKYDIPIHIIRKIVLLNTGRITEIKSHFRNRDLYTNFKITEIPRKIKNV